MSENRILTSPIDLVTKALNLKPGIVNENSAMGETPNWDSLNHVVIINDIETSYAVTIPDNEIEKYITMKAIIQLYNKQSGFTTSENGFKKFLKKIPIIKEFVK